MARGILCLSVLVWQLSAAGEAAQYCACVRMRNKQLVVPYCFKCDYEGYPDDYRRSPDPQGGTLLDAVRNTIKRRSSSGSCHQHDQYIFRDNGQMCNLLLDISKQKKGPDADSTTYISTTTLNDITTSIDVFTDENSSSGESQSNNRDDFEDKTDKKETKGSDRTGGVSAGVVVAIAVICFLLGLLAMWLILKYCRKMALQELRHTLGGDKNKMNPPSGNVQQVPNVNTNTAEFNSPDRLPEADISVSHRTSYEGLQPENRTSRVYNVIDPAYQTPEQSGSSVPKPPGEYFILEKENKSDKDASTALGQSGSNAVPPTTTADYFVLEKEASRAVDSDTTNTEPDKVRGDAAAQHDYFVLEQRNSAGAGHNNNHRENGDTSGNTANEYFILEKENDIDTQNG